MATLLVPPGQVKKMLVERIQTGQDVAAKVEVAERTGGYRDWFQLFATWREETIAKLKSAFEGEDIVQEFGWATESTQRSSPLSTFEYRKTKVGDGIRKLESLIERLLLALSESQDPAGIKSLHPEIYSKCRSLYEGGDYGEAVEKGFKIVRDRLRSLTRYETAYGRKLLPGQSANRHCGRRAKANSFSSSRDP